MYGLADERAATGGAPPGPPGTRVEVVLRSRPVGAREAYPVNGPERPAGDQGASQYVRLLEAVLKADGQHPPSRRRRIRELDARPCGGGERLLAIHVQPGVECAPHVLGMQEGWRGHDDCVTGAAGEQ